MKFSDYANIFEKQANAAILSGAEVYKKNLERNYSSYQLAKQVVIENNLNFISVGVDADYAYYLEYGNNESGQYIYPNNAKALRFIANGQLIFAKKVRTYEGKHIAEKTLEESQEEIYSAIINNL